MCFFMFFVMFLGVFRCCFVLLCWCVFVLICIWWLLILYMYLYIYIWFVLCVWPLCVCLDVCIYIVCFMICFVLIIYILHADVCCDCCLLLFVFCVDGVVAVCLMLSNRYWFVVCFIVVFLWCVWLCFLNYHYYLIWLFCIWLFDICIYIYIQFVVLYRCYWYPNYNIDKINRYVFFLCVYYIHL